MLGGSPGPTAYEAGEDADSFSGCWKKKPTRSVIPVFISVMFTVMLLCIYTAKLLLKITNF